MASANWLKVTTQKAGAMRCHFGQYEREHGNHSNPDIDTSLSHLNYAIGCDDYGEAYERMKVRTKAVDALQPPKRLRKDRITGCLIEIPCPASVRLSGRSDEFFEKTYEVMQAFFGAENVHGGFVHKDEVHDYIDKDGKPRTSLEHMHTLVSAFTEEKGINGKAFETIARLKAFNEKMCEICQREFGIEWNTKETPQKKSAERLKEESALREVICELTAEKEQLQEEIQKQEAKKISLFRKVTYGDYVKMEQELADEQQSSKSWKSKYMKMKKLRDSEKEEKEKLQTRAEKAEAAYAEATKPKPLMTTEKLRNASKDNDARNKNRLLCSVLGVPEHSSYDETRRILQKNGILELHKNRTNELE